MTQQIEEFIINSDTSVILLQFNHLLIHCESLLCWHWHFLLKAGATKQAVCIQNFMTKVDHRTAPSCMHKQDIILKLLFQTLFGCRPTYWNCSTDYQHNFTNPIPKPFLFQQVYLYFCINVDIQFLRRIFATKWLAWMRGCMYIYLDQLTWQ